MRSRHVAVRLLLLVSLSALYACAAARPATPPPNILFILTDNQPASILGAYGNPDVRTPNIDKLAADGVRFDRFYAVNGMCSPTRATLMTGLMPSQHGLHNWLDDRMLEDWPRDWSAVAEFRTLPLTLRNRGYQTAMIGKWHLGQPWQPSLGYDHWVTFTDGHTVDFWHNTVIDNDDVYEVNDVHIVDFFTDQAVEFIASVDANQPFYLQLNYDGPYLNPPTNLGPARNRFYDEYVGQSFDSFPRVAFNENMARQLMAPEQHPPFLVKKIFEALQMHNDPATMANVASQNTLVDDGVGKVLAALEARGLAENTLVVFSSDQGNFYGQHGIWEHTIVTTPSNLHETAMRVPLIFRHSGALEGGRTSDALIGQYDLPATLLDYAGFDDVAFDSSPGRSFAADLRGDSRGDDAAARRDAVYFEQEETRGVRTARYAYWERIEGLGEPVLYDMLADPAQLTNLAGRESSAVLQRELSNRLKVFFDTYADPAYDLWSGGVAKGSVMRPSMFRALYGDDWQTRTELLPAFEEAASASGEDR